jgi:hypothetical protein
MTASKLRAFPVLTAAALVATSCIVVEDFEGYAPLPKKPAGPPAACAVVPCGGGNAGACEPVVLDSAFPVGTLSSDAESLAIRQYDFDAIHRIAKPGCSVPRVDLQVIHPEWVVVDHDYFAWTKRGNDVTCIASGLFFCDPRNCKPTEIPVLGGAQIEFEKLAGIALGDDHLYFMLTDGLVGRAPRGGTTHEPLWIDPAYKKGSVAALLYGVQLHDNRLHISRYSLGTDIENSCDDGEQGSTGAVFALDPIAGATEKVLVANTNQTTTLAVSKDYVFYFTFDGSLMNRVPRGGGSAEALMPGGELAQADALVDHTLAAFAPIEVHGKWVYFGAKTSNGGQAIARLPANAGGAWTAASAEIVARPSGWFSFVVDDEALYWTECNEATPCETGRLMGRVLPP